MKSIIIVITSVFIICSCNNSDKVEKLPLGYEVFYEGGSQNRLSKNNELIIDSGLVECKFENDYLLVSVDTTYSMNPEKVNKINLKYFIQNTIKENTIRKISYKDLQDTIKEKSLENIDITR